MEEIRYFLLEKEPLDGNLQLNKPKKERVPLETFGVLSNPVLNQRQPGGSRIFADLGNSRNNCVQGRATKHVGRPNSSVDAHRMV